MEVSKNIKSDIFGSRKIIEIRLGYKINNQVFWGILDQFYETEDFDVIWLYANERTPYNGTKQDLFHALKFWYMTTAEENPEQAEKWANRSWPMQTKEG